MVKRILCMTVLLTGLTILPAYAKIGDIAGNIYTTDILTQVDGRDIQGYAIDGKTLIALEDLKDYGFNVYYNDNIRTVFITKSGDAQKDFMPSLPRGKVGEIAGNYYETDIRAVVNGMEVSEAYAIEGRMVAPVEVIGEDRRYSPMHRHIHQMTYTYDDTNRLLSLDTSLDKYGTPDDAKTEVINQRSMFYPFEDILHQGETVCAMKSWRGMSAMTGTNYSRYVSLGNGLAYDAERAAVFYGLNIGNGVLADNGKKLYFENVERESRKVIDYKQIELDTLHIYPLDEKIYNAAMNELKDGSEYTITVNGVNVPIYTIASRDAIKASDLKALGYTREFNEEYLPLGWWFGMMVDGPMGGTAISGMTYRYDVYNKTITAEFERE